jgi:hypothetical protein
MVYVLGFRGKGRYYWFPGNDVALDVARFQESLIASLRFLLQAGAARGDALYSAYIHNHDVHDFLPRTENTGFGVVLAVLDVLPHEAHIQICGCEIIQQISVMMTHDSVNMTLTGASSLRLGAAKMVVSRAMHHSGEDVRRATEEAWRALVATEVREELTATSLSRAICFQKDAWDDIITMQRRQRQLDNTTALVRRHLLERQALCRVQHWCCGALFLFFGQHGVCKGIVLLPFPCLLRLDLWLRATNNTMCNDHAQNEQKKGWIY